MAVQHLSGFGSADASTIGNEGVLELTWEVFGELCRALALNVARDYEPDMVIGIAKAGVIPGAVIASILRCDFYSMKISRRSATGEMRDQPRLMTSAPTQAHGKRVLIVDEICTTGETLRMALAAVRHVLPAEIRTATSFVKSGHFKPDYFAVETDSLVIFPWDRKVVEDSGALVVNPQYDGIL